jgi:hypothetical protein
MDHSPGTPSRSTGSSCTSAATGQTRADLVEALSDLGSERRHPVVPERLEPRVSFLQGRGRSRAAGGPSLRALGEAALARDLEVLRLQGLVQCKAEIRDRLYDRLDSLVATSSKGWPQ